MPFSLILIHSFQRAFLLIFISPFVKMAREKERPRTTVNSALALDLFLENGLVPEFIIVEEPFDDPQPNSLPDPVRPPQRYKTNPGRERYVISYEPLLSCYVNC